MSVTANMADHPKGWGGSANPSLDEPQRVPSAGGVDGTGESRTPAPCSSMKLIDIIWYSWLTWTLCAALWMAFCAWSWYR